MRSWVVSAALVAATAVAAFGHGGEYYGPAGEVPPDSREPDDPPPPPPEWRGWWDVARREFAVLSDSAAAERRRRVRAALERQAVLALRLLADDDTRIALRDEAVLALGRLRLASAAEQKPAVEKLAPCGHTAAQHDEALRLVEDERDRLDVLRTAATSLCRSAPGCAAEFQERAARVVGSLLGSCADATTRRGVVFELGRFASATDTVATARAVAVHDLVGAFDAADAEFRPYAALALGLAGRSSDPNTAWKCRATLRWALDGTRGDDRDVLAVSLGLARDELASETLANLLFDPAQDLVLRGDCALALGMIGGPRAAGALRIAFAAEHDREFRLRCAMAARLLGDAFVERGLVADLRDRDAEPPQVDAAIEGLAEAGDVTAVAALVEVAVDAGGRFPERTRCLAIEALGRLAE